jgi:hypothetical protein
LQTENQLSVISSEFSAAGWISNMHAKKRSGTR